MGKAGRKPARSFEAFISETQQHRCVVCMAGDALNKALLYALSCGGSRRKIFAWLKEDYNFKAKGDSCLESHVADCLAFGGWTIAKVQLAEQREELKQAWLDSV